MSLSEIRKEIDAVDEKIRALFISRMNLAERVAVEKARTEDEIFKPDRERDIIERQSRGVDEDMRMEYRALVKRVMEISRKYQYGLTLKLRDCFPFTYQAQESPVRTIGMVRDSLYLAMEEELWDAFTAGGAGDAEVAKESQAVFALPEDARETQTKRGEAPRLHTCRTYEELGCMLREGSLDAGAGVIEHIGSGVSDALNTALTTNQLYINRCQVLKDGEEKLKVVRFSRDLVVREEHNRLKLVMVLPNRSGALGSILSMIADYGVNVTEIHSIPYRVQGDAWNYKFYLELNLNLLRDESRALVFQLASETENLQLLGSYRCVGDFVL